MRHPGDKRQGRRSQGEEIWEGPDRAGTQLQNWKMATEGGGRHSPSTVVWEEEGVPVILVTHPLWG